MPLEPEKSLKRDTPFPPWPLVVRDWDMFLKTGVDLRSQPMYKKQLAQGGVTVIRVTH